MNTFDYSQTYLYKLHKLTNQLDKTFDQTLRKQAGIGMSQFTLLLSISQHQPVTQRTVADFLDLSAGAISRQVDIASQNGWVTILETTSDKRSQLLEVTPKGKAVIASGMNALEHHVFGIFDHSGSSMHLMNHIDLLLGNISSLSDASAPVITLPHGELPKAADLFLTNGGDVNRAVIEIQKSVGHHVSEKWWAKHIGKSANDLATATRFDKAYEHYVEQIADIDK